MGRRWLALCGLIVACRSPESGPQAEGAPAAETRKFRATFLLRDEVIPTPPPELSCKPIVRAHEPSKTPNNAADLELRLLQAAAQKTARTDSNGVAAIADLDAGAH